MQVRVVPEIGMLRAMWRELETGPRITLTGHEGGNSGYRQGASLRVTAPALDPTRILEVYFSECNAEHPNYALIRKYYKTANSSLKALLLFGLDQHPTSIDLLSDLAYFHEYEYILRELIARFTLACEKEDDLSKFREIAQDFNDATIPDGYDALHALRELFSSNTQKREIIELLIAEHKESKMKDRAVHF